MHRINQTDLLVYTTMVYGMILFELFSLSPRSWTPGGLESHHQPCVSFGVCVGGEGKLEHPRGDPTQTWVAHFQKNNGPPGLRVPLLSAVQTAASAAAATAQFLSLLVQHCYPFLGLLSVCHWRAGARQREQKRGVLSARHVSSTGAELTS